MFKSKKKYTRIIGDVICPSLVFHSYSNYPNVSNCLSLFMVGSDSVLMVLLGLITLTTQSSVVKTNRLENLCNDFENPNSVIDF